MYRLKKQNPVGQEFPFQLCIDEYKSGESVELHVHEFTEMVYIAGGQGIYQYKEQKTRIRQGSLLIIQPGMKHAFQVARGSYLKLYRITIDQSLFSDDWTVLDHALTDIDPFFIDPTLVRRNDFTSSFVLDSGQQFELLVLLNRIYKEYNQRMWGQHCLIRLQLMELFLYLGRWSAHEHHEPSETTIESNEDLFDTIRSYVKTNYMQPISLKQMCDYCGMSRSTFTKYFKEAAGMSFIDYRNTIRIQVAKKLLITTSLTITMIAQKVGFSDISNFNRTFKHFEHLTPLIYRKSQVDSE